MVVYQRGRRNGFDKQLASLSTAEGKKNFISRRTSIFCIDGSYVVWYSYYTAEYTFQNNHVKNDCLCLDLLLIYRNLLPWSGAGLLEQLTHLTNNRIFKVAPFFFPHSSSTSGQIIVQCYAFVPLLALLALCQGYSNKSAFSYCEPRTNHAPGRLPVSSLIRKLVSPLDPF